MEEESLRGKRKTVGVGQAETPPHTPFIPGGSQHLSWVLDEPVSTKKR